METKLLIGELLDFIDDVVDELGSREQINYVHEIMKNGCNNNNAINDNAIAW